MNFTDQEVEDALHLFDLDWSASSEDIAREYRYHVKVWHPDRYNNNDGLRKKAEEKTKEINEAYAMLKAWLEAGRPEARSFEPGSNASQHEREHTTGGPQTNNQQHSAPFNHARQAKPDPPRPSDSSLSDLVVSAIAAVLVAFIAICSVGFQLLGALFQTGERNLPHIKSIFDKAYKRVKPVVLTCLKVSLGLGVLAVLVVWGSKDAARKSSTSSTYQRSNNTAYTAPTITNPSFQNMTGASSVGEPVQLTDEQVNWLLEYVQQHGREDELIAELRKRNYDPKRYFEALYGYKEPNDPVETEAIKLAKTADRQVAPLPQKPKAVETPVKKKEPVRPNIVRHQKTLKNLHLLQKLTPSLTNIDTKDLEDGDREVLSRIFSLPADRIARFRWGHSNAPPGHKRADTIWFTVWKLNGTLVTQHYRKNGSRVF